MLKSESGYDFPLKIPRWLPISVEVKAKVHTITTKPFPLLLISPLIPLALRSLHPSHSTFLQFLHHTRTVLASGLCTGCSLSLECFSCLWCLYCSHPHLLSNFSQRSLLSEAPSDCLFKLLFTTLSPTVLTPLTSSIAYLFIYFLGGLHVQCGA